MVTADQLASTRKLAAILSADVAGYSALMSADEEGTVRKLREVREAVLPIIERFGGRVIDLAGDGILAEFPSAVRAVESAAAVQSRMEELNAKSDPAMLFRIGVNVGDVIHEGERLYGDGINVAARLQAIAEPGGICISNKVHEEVRDRLKLAFKDMGDQDLKNIPRPVRAFSADLGAVGSHPGVSERNRNKEDLNKTSRSSDAATRTAPAIPNKPSIAVLAFQNMSGDPEQEYFADGVVEDIITALSRFKDLFVIARNSSFTYKGKAVDIKKIGRELGVRYVLEGSLRKLGGRLRISAQLIHVETGTHVWADKFDGLVEDLFDFQDRVTASVVAAIFPSVERTEMAQSTRRTSDNLDAYDYYYRSLHTARPLTLDACRDALRLARQAIALDPSFTAAYGWAGMLYSLRPILGRLLNEEEIAEAEQFALKAVELGPDDAGALASAAIVFGFVSKKPEVAEAMVDQSLIVNPNLFQAWQTRGWISVWLGKHEAAIEQFKYAMRLNPVDPLLYWVEGGMANALLFLKRFDQSLEWVTKALARNPQYAPALRYATVAYAMQGRLEDAGAMLKRLQGMGAYWTISELRKFIPYQPEDANFYVEGFRLAGVPE